MGTTFWKRKSCSQLSDCCELPCEENRPYLKARGFYLLVRAYGIPYGRQNPFLNILRSMRLLQIYRVFQFSVSALTLLMVFRKIERLHLSVKRDSEGSQECKILKLAFFVQKLKIWLLIPLPKRL